MVIDLILDRKDDLHEGIREYMPDRFYRDVRDYDTYNTQETTLTKILQAMDYGTETDVQDAICNYILKADYNPTICDFVRSVNWLTADWD